MDDSIAQKIAAYLAAMRQPTGPLVPMTPNGFPLASPPQREERAPMPQVRTPGVRG